MSLVIVGGEDLDSAVEAFRAEGFEAGRAAWVSTPDGTEDVMLALEGGAEAALADADGRGLKYTLIHVGADDGLAGGTYARAHHRVPSGQLPELARRLRSRERMLLTSLSFGYKNGLPEGADWVVDCRLLANPYWVSELRALDGRDQAVVDYVLGQPVAGQILDGIEALMRVAVPRYRSNGRSSLTVAFGCSGGRHRSVVMAAELARRLADLPEVDVEVRGRETAHR